MDPQQGRGESLPLARTPTPSSLGFGYSQTRGYLDTYIGALHRRVTRENGGRPPYDGYLIGGAGAAFTGLVPHVNRCVPHAAGRGSPV